MSRLFEVEITFRSVIVADDEKHALEVMSDQSSEILRNDDYDMDVGREITSIGGLPAPWDGGCYPWGGDGTKTIQQYLDAPPEPQPERDTQTIDMFGQQEKDAP